MQVAAIASVAFPSVHLRVDGNDVTQFVGVGGGTVNTQFGVAQWEKLRLEPQDDDTVAIASVAFPGVYLRLDGSGVTQFLGDGGGTVNAQFGVGPWEKFRLAPQTLASGGLVFDGQSAYVEIPDNTDFSVPTTGSLAIAAWLRPDSTHFQRTEGSGYVYWLAKGAPGQEEWAFRMYSQPNLEDRANRISFYVFDQQHERGIGSYFQDVVDPGEWIHVVVVVTNEIITIYKNGVHRDCDVYFGSGSGQTACNTYGSAEWITPQHTTASVRMATRYADARHSYFQGAMRDVLFWNRPLTPDEVASLYQSSAVPPDGLTAQYRLNEGSGDIAHDSAGGHHGNIFGASWLPVG